MSQKGRSARELRQNPSGSDWRPRIEQPSLLGVTIVAAVPRPLVPLHLFNAISATETSATTLPFLSFASISNIAAATRAAIALTTHRLGALDITQR
jgi:hypothetical protein